MVWQKSLEGPCPKLQGQGTLQEQASNKVPTACQPLVLAGPLAAWRGEAGKPSTSNPTVKAPNFASLISDLSFFLVCSDHSIGGGASDTGSDDAVAPGGQMAR